MPTDGKRSSGSSKRTRTGEVSCPYPEVEGLCPGSIIPLERRMKIVSTLSRRARKGRSVSFCVDSESGDPLVLLSIMAIDWPGLANICLSELHHHGWNLDVVEGFNVENDEGKKLGFIIAGIRDESPERRREFQRNARQMQSLLVRMAEGSSGTVSLLSRAAERIERYQEVLDALEKSYKGQPLPEGFLGEKGELVLFLSSRSDEYLRERKPEDLAWIVRKNYELVQGVRKRRGRPMFQLRNIRTTREYLTGINIAGYERNVSLQDCLTALSFAWPGSTVRHQRRYTTVDGVVAIRIEMAGPTGLAATREEQGHIFRTLKTLLVKNELDRLKRIHRYGGREHYARALIPLLLRECESTKLNQVYISLLSTSTFTVELKLILVSIVEGAEEHDRLVIGFVGEIESVDGFGVVSFKSPSSYGDRWVDIIDVTVQRDHFPEIESAYDAIKASIEKTFGHFRDFDMGMRLNDVRQLEEIQRLLSSLPENVVRDSYYHLEDFLRGSAPVEELALHIKLAYDAMVQTHGGKGPVKPLHATIRDPDDPDRGIATLLCCPEKGQGTMFQDLLEVVREYRVTASAIDWPGGVAVLLKLQHQGGPLPEDQLEKVLSKLQEVLRPVWRR
ncbi:hypothetical protein JW921_01010 [Candidatus Fermentibacterales bacterium]|nr:hypothetical protein [Candidatus Fermentibacterales bacterium]